MDLDPSGLVSKVGLQIFHFICLAVTILLVVWQIYVYVQNNDVSRVGYEKFHSSASEIYPSVSLCFGDVLLQEKLNDYGVNKSYYLNFLKGLVWDEQLLYIKYDNVSTNLNDHLLGIEMYQEKFNGDIEPSTYHLFDNTRSNSKQWKPKIHQLGSPFSSLIQKCLTIDVPYTPRKRISWVTIIMSRSVFPNGRRPPNFQAASDLFSVSIHYPNQRLRYSKMKIDWDAKEPKSTDLNSYGMKFYITGLEVMRKRNTKRTPCNEYGTLDDNTIRRRLIKEIGCVPPYWTIRKQGLKIDCSDQRQLEEYFQMNITEFKVPCRRMTQISFLYSEYVSDYYHSRLGIIPIESQGMFFVTLMFPDSRYKQIEMLREVNMQSLIGNAGGFVGICLGYSILQLPSLLLMVYKKVKTLTMPKVTSTAISDNTEVSFFVGQK